MAMAAGNERWQTGLRDRRGRSQSQTRRPATVISVAAISLTPFSFARGHRLGGGANIAQLADFFDAPANHRPNLSLKIAGAHGVTISLDPPARRWRLVPGAWLNAHANFRMS